MTLPHPITASTIRLAPEEVQPVMQMFRSMTPELELAIVDVQGEILASSAEFSPAQMQAALLEVASGVGQNHADHLPVREVSGLRAYPISIHDQHVATLLARGTQIDAPQVERVVVQFLLLISAQRVILNTAQTRTSQLEVIMEITRELSSTLDLEKLLQLIMTSAVQILGAGSGSLFLVDEATGDLVFRVVTSGDEHIIGSRVPFGKGIVGQVASTGQPIISIDVEKDERFFDQLDHSGFQTRSLMAVPLRVPDRLIGVVELINKVDGTDFDEDDKALLVIFAAQAAIAVENARLVQEELTKERLEQELQLAYKVQSSLMPTRTPQLEGWEFASWWKPAKQVSGDYYDFIPKADRLGLVIADVSDKGMHAALFMALTRSVIRATALSFANPSESLTQANRLICADSTGGMFVTLFYAEINPADHTITYVNCGHNPPMWYSASERSITEVKRTAMMMGFDDRMQCQQKVLNIQTGDVIAFFTDGIPEAFNADREQFGDERLRQLIIDHAHQSPQQILEVVQDALESFTGATPQSDDVTIVIAKRQ